MASSKTHRSTRSTRGLGSHQDFFLQSLLSHTFAYEIKREIKIFSCDDYDDTEKDNDDTEMD